MSLFQIHLEGRLKKAIQLQAEHYGVPASSLVRIVLVNAFLDQDDSAPGNVFNAERDNKGKGISAKRFLKLMKNAR